MIATVDLVLFLTKRNTSFHTTPALTLAKLYSNSLLVLFNSRITIVGGRNSSDTSRGNVSSNGALTSGFSSRRRGGDTEGNRTVEVSLDPSHEASAMGDLHIQKDIEMWVRSDSESASAV